MGAGKPAGPGVAEVATEPPVAGPWRNRITRYGSEPPDQLLGHESNWRIHTRGQQDALKGVLETVGLVQNVIISERSGKCLDGHLRIQMAISEGQPTVPITYVDVTEQEEKIILATIDPLSAMAVADEDMLRGLIVDIGDLESASVNELLASLGSAEAAPEASPVSDENLEIEHSCPKCGYRWSGKPA